MIMMYCTYALPIENRERFAKELDTIAGPLVRKEKGCHQYTYFIPVDPNDKTLLLVEKWENQECLDMHMHGEAMKTVVEIKKKYDAVTTATKYEIK